MALYESDFGEEEWFRALATLPLPEAAVVIDARQSDRYDAPLLEYLTADIGDLTAEMRLHQIPRWRHLAACIDIVHIDAIPPVEILFESTDFIITTHSGKQIPIQGRDDLAKFLGRDYLDRVRNHRIRAIQDSGTDTANLRLDVADPERPTVRVLFLTDMEEPESLTRAATYAQWLKEWNELTHGVRRFTRDECLQTTIVCLQADVVSYSEVLLSTVGQLPDTAIDTVILLQTYSDDEAYIGGDIQIYQAELILYTLLLRWPEVLRKTIDDPYTLRAHMVSEATMLPWPTYTLGIAAMEYSARWAMRWLDYSLTTKLLESIRDTQKAEQEHLLISTNIGKWLNNWWQKIKEIVPEAMTGVVDDLEVFDNMQRRLSSSAFPRSAPCSALWALDTFRQQVSELYLGTSGSSLQRALESAPLLLDQFKWAYNQRHVQQQEENWQDEADASYKQLVDQYTWLRQFLSLHFQGAGGTFPRAAHQLAALNEAISSIRMVEQHPPDVQAYKEEFEQQVEMARDELARAMKLWRLPLLGKRLRSTVISLLVVIVLGATLLFAVDWQSLIGSILPHVLSDTAFFFLRLSGESSTIENITTISVKALLILVLIVGEWFYLARRTRFLRRECQRIYRDLRQTVQGHCANIGTVIAARVALALLQWAELYEPGEKVSPYERRLQTFEAVLKTGYEQAARQKALADTHLRRVLDQQQNGALQDYQWLGLNNRKGVLTWQQLEDVFLQLWNDLQSNNAAWSLLSEMLLRQLGTESPTELLQDILNKQQIAQNNGEVHFQVVSTLLTTLLLSSAIIRPQITEVLPLLNQYIALKELSVQESSAGGSNALDLASIVKGALLERNAGLSIQQDVPTASLLAAWIGRQRHNNPQLAQLFEVNDVLDRLAEKASFSQVLNALRAQSKLLGYPDEIDGEDAFYLFIAPGETGRVFMHSSNVRQDTQVHPELFPDREKLVYLHVHRIRQFLPGPAVAVQKKR